MVWVWVDERERACTIRARMAQRTGFNVRLRRLSSGDYAVNGTIGIERKTYDDLARSIVDARLFRQLKALRWTYPRPLLLLERFVPGSAAAGVPWPAIRGALVSVGAVFGVPILYSSGESESAELIAAAALQLGRSYADGYVRPGARPKGWRRRALHLLQGLPGIGPSRAAALLDEFGSVRGVLNADELSLAEVPGMGPLLARRIVAAAGPERL